MRTDWQTMENAPIDRVILVCGGRYRYHDGSNGFDYLAGRHVFTVGWDGQYWRDDKVKDRIHMPKYWHEAVPPVPDDVAD